MAKMFLSLGFWMTIVLFIALGYAFDFAHGAEYSETAIDHAGDRVRQFYRTKISASSKMICKAATSYRAVDARETRRRAATLLDFQQMANLQDGGPAYAPGFSFSITRQPPQLSICPGPIEIPRH